MHLSAGSHERFRAAKPSFRTGEPWNCRANIREALVLGTKGSAKSYRKGNNSTKQTGDVLDSHPLSQTFEFPPLSFRSMTNRAGLSALYIQIRHLGVSKPLIFPSDDSHPSLRRE